MNATSIASSAAMRLKGAIAGSVAGKDFRITIAVKIRVVVLTPRIMLSVIFAWAKAAS